MQGGGGSGKYLRNLCRKFVSGIIWYPRANFFKNHQFFHQFFWDPPNFFRKCKFFPLKIWDPPIFFHKWKFFLRKVWDPPIFLPYLFRFTLVQRGSNHSFSVQSYQILVWSHPFRFTLVQRGFNYSLSVRWGVHPCGPSKWLIHQC